MSGRIVVSRSRPVATFVLIFGSVARTECANVGESAGVKSTFPPLRLPDSLSFSLSLFPPGQVALSLPLDLRQFRRCQILERHMVLQLNNSAPYASFILLQKQ